MSNVPHELAADFPELKDRIHELKTTNEHFHRRFEEYETVNKAVHRGETDIEPMSDEHLNSLRVQRAALKDELYAMLKDDAS